MGRASRTKVVPLVSRTPTPAHQVTYQVTLYCPGGSCGGASIGYRVPSGWQEEAVRGDTWSHSFACDAGEPLRVCAEWKEWKERGLVRVEIFLDDELLKSCEDTEHVVCATFAPAA